ncbi:hypothetical protein OO007_01050 [Cocleimonas sp. KMM 6892]|uniref:hypothetical protein n=1 Tax=unclassified Cocleimonas TaxID=2639732 RepID=UPI002DBD46BB|nr:MULTISPECIES: hypothetical protein [unclassified Cocleimonas]MEB8430792.1 hypothetical protein [Cocleimonas sp. KMM 6892]MEC4714436.1 hypothetical protein [Cocleimonas sp. KMM 6895]MEC4743769.1 hypothetical protein [Cocleimonas sp. KMM 6896]
MKKLLLITAVALSAISVPASACNYKQAQTKMMEVNNMMQIHNRKFAASIQKGQEPNPADERVRQGLATESAAAGILLSKESEKNPNIQYGTKVNPAICAKYDGIMKKYAPAGYKKAPINRAGMLTTKGQKSNASGCNAKNIWDRYGVAIKKQSALSKQGRITKQENGAYMSLMTRFGQQSTTNVNQACVTLSQIEKKLSAE